MAELAAAVGATATVKVQTQDATQEQIKRRRAYFMARGIKADEVQEAVNAGIKGARVTPGLGWNDYKVAGHLRKWYGVQGLKPGVMDAAEMIARLSGEKLDAFLKELSLRLALRAELLALLTDERTAVEALAARVGKRWSATKSLADAIDDLDPDTVRGEYARLKGVADG